MTYGIRHSAENRSLSEQGQTPVVSYSSQVVTGPEPTMEEQPQYPQPQSQAQADPEARPEWRKITFN